jgi:DNA-binding SARP family transcriptional activator
MRGTAGTARPPGLPAAGDAVAGPRGAAGAGGEQVSGSPLAVQLLGPVRAWRNGVEIDLGAARRRAVFTVLAVRANQAVSKGELIGGVWGDAPPASAEASLYTYVSGLRRALEPQRSRRSPGTVLPSTGAGYCLRLDPEVLDMHRFDQHRERAQRLAAGDPAAALAELDGALALWRDDALLGMPGPFAESQRSRLGELRLATVERRAELALRLGRHAEVTAELPGLTVEHPLREGLRVLLMTALHRTGRHTEALEVFHDARRVLVDEIGSEPGPALQRLHRQILRDSAAAPDPTRCVAAAPTSAGGRAEPDRTADAAAAQPGVPAAGRGAEPAGTAVAAPAQHGVPATFVGREAELDLLRRAVSGMAAGRGRCLWIEGEPGIGKSALLAAGLSGAQDAGCRVAWAAAGEPGRRRTLQAILDCLDTGPAPVPAGGDHVLQAIDRLLARVEELCAQAPLVLVVDDLPQADEAAVLGWYRLSRVLHRLPLLLVGAGRLVPRRTDVEQVRRAVVGSGGEVVALGPLPAGSVDALLTALVGAEPGESLRRTISCAGGNPRYTREVLDALRRGNAVAVRNGVAEVVPGATRDARESLVPALTGRLGFLSADTTDVLRRAALLGLEFTIGDASTVTGRPAPDLLAAVEEATAAGVLGSAGPRLAFRHPLIRLALYHGMPASVRTALHRQAAQALAAAWAPLELVAEQLAAAPTAVDSWVVEWLLANATALGRRAPDLAVRLLRTVAEHPSADAGHRERLAARLAQLAVPPAQPPEAEAQHVPASEGDRRDPAGAPVVPVPVVTVPVSAAPVAAASVAAAPVAAAPVVPVPVGAVDGALRVQLLGPVRAWRGGREVRLGSSRPRAVFAMLAMRAGAVIPRQELVTGVWGEQPPATAHGSLHTYVSALRKALEPDRERGGASLLESVGSGYRLRLDPQRSDVAEFDRLREQARRQLDDGDPRGAMRALDRALELWRGEALSGVSGPFARAQRHRLTEGRTAAREQRAAAGLAAGLPAAVVAELAALVGEEPLRERPRELLMLALHRSGRSAEALEAFREARRVLLAELGVEPGPGLREMHEHVLASAPDPALGGGPARRPAGADPSRRRTGAGAGDSPGDAREAADALLPQRVGEAPGGGAPDSPPDLPDRGPAPEDAAGRLDELSGPTREVLRWAALLGVEFALDDLSAVLGRPAAELARPLEEAVAAGVLRDAGQRPAFRHPLIRQALYEGTPAALRVALHQQAAQALARSGAPVEQVAGQLLATDGDIAPWVVEWLLNAAPVLQRQAPAVAVELLQRALRSPRAGGERGTPLMTHLADALFGVGRDAEAREYVRRAAARTS